MTMTIIQGLWKEGNKKNKLLWKCLWSRDIVKFQIAFWALEPTSTKVYEFGDYYYYYFLHHQFVIANAFQCYTLGRGRKAWL